MEKMENIERKEIRGLSAKSLFWLISCTVSIVFSIFTMYFNLAAQIDKINLLKDGDNRYNELRLKNMEQKIDINAMAIKDLQDKISK